MSASFSLSFPLLYVSIYQDCCAAACRSSACVDVAFCVLHVSFANLSVDVSLSLSLSPLLPHSRHNHLSLLCAVSPLALVISHCIRSPLSDCLCIRKSRTRGASDCVCVCTCSWTGTRTGRARLCPIIPHLCVYCVSVCTLIHFSLFLHFPSLPVSLCL